MNELLLLPSSNWTEKNVHLAKALPLLVESDSSSFMLDLTSIRAHVEETFNQSPQYVILNDHVRAVIEAAIGYALKQERNYEIECLRSGSHKYWRHHQIVIKLWSEIVESLVHERGSWGELQEVEGYVLTMSIMNRILTLMPCCNSMDMHKVIIADPKGTTHPEASVWKNEEGIEEEPEPGMKLRISSLMRSSVDDELDEKQRKELDQELQITGVTKKVLRTWDCELVIPMLTVRGQLELTASTLSFTMNPDFEAQFKEQVAKQDAQRAMKKMEGVNKYTMLKLPENRIWKLTELTHEEYRLYSVDLMK